MRRPGWSLSRKDLCRLSSTQRQECQCTSDSTNSKDDRHLPDCAARSATTRMRSQRDHRFPKDPTTGRSSTSEASSDERQERWPWGRPDLSSSEMRSTRLLSTRWPTRVTSRGRRGPRTFWSTTARGSRRKSSSCSGRRIKLRSMNLILDPKSLKTRRKSWGEEMQSYQTNRVCARLHQSIAAILVITPTETARLSSIVFTKMPSVATNVSSIFIAPV